MKAELINPFIASTLHVFQTMFATKLERGPLYLRKPNETHGGLSGVIGLSGKATGIVAVVVSDETAIQVTSRFLGTPIESVTADVVDCIGELVNMIVGNAKAQMQQYELSISLPSIVRGSDHLVEFPKEVTPICVPFSGEVGDLMLQVGFVVRE